MRNGSESRNLCCMRNGNDIKCRLCTFVSMATPNSFLMFIYVAHVRISNVGKIPEGSQRSVSSFWSV